MRTCGYILLALLAAWPCASALGQAPPEELTFARAGAKAVAQIRLVKHPVGQVVLRAYGRAWTKPTPTRSVPAPDFAEIAEIEVPSVRVPTVFSITAADNAGIVVGEVVAYPAQDVTWDKKIILYTSGTPKWFDHWATATGLPVKPVGAEDKWSAADQNGADTKALLILGRSAAGKSPAELLKLARQKDINILVLEADWFGEPGGEAMVAPNGMQEGLAEVGKQSWPQPLKFDTRRRPWGGIANRWAWIADEKGLPLVEAVAHVDPPPPDSKESVSVRPVLLSYLPWQTQLGRSESADATLLALLAAAAKAVPTKFAGHPVWFIYPDKKDLDKKTRPVLAAIHSVEGIIYQDRKPDYTGPIYCIVDLRGGKPLGVTASELSQHCHDCAFSAPSTRLIFLGDRPLLDEWKWLKIDRDKKTILAYAPNDIEPHTPVLWLPDNDLPPSSESQVKLMLALTRLGVLLAPPGEEEQKK